MIDPVPANSMARDPEQLLRNATRLAQQGFAGALDAARLAATQFVSSAFIVPVLATLHESSFQVEPFAPNFAENRFAPLLDEQIADRIVGSANFKLVDVIVDRVMRRSAAEPRPEVLDVRG